MYAIFEGRSERWLALKLGETVALGWASVFIAENKKEKKETRETDFL